MLKKCILGWFIGRISGRYTVFGIILIISVTYSVTLGLYNKQRSQVMVADCVQRCNILYKMEDDQEKKQVKIYDKHHIFCNVRIV